MNSKPAHHRKPSRTSRRSAGRNPAPRVQNRPSMRSSVLMMPDRPADWPPAWSGFGAILVPVISLPSPVGSPVRYSPRRPL